MQHQNARWMVFPWISFQNLRCCTFGIWTLLCLCSRNRCIGEHLWLLEEISAKDSCNHWAKLIAISQSANLNPFEILCTGRSLLFKIYEPMIEMILYRHTAQNPPVTFQQPLISFTWRSDAHWFESHFYCLHLFCRWYPCVRTVEACWDVADFCCFWGSDGSVTVHHGGCEIGQGYGAQSAVCGVGVFFRKRQ